jgi:hypothetical protein
MANDCDQFREDVRELSPSCREMIDANPDRAGHDFWLTRNGHGCGFWDGDWPEPAATILTNASNACGECDLYIGDDGRIYIQ